VGSAAFLSLNGRKVSGQKPGVGPQEGTQVVSPIFFFGAVFIRGAAVVGALRHRGESWWMALGRGLLATLTLLPFLPFVFSRTRGPVRITAVLLIAFLLLSMIVLRRRRNRRNDNE
jgi:hypothetical protein